MTNSNLWTYRDTLDVSRDIVGYNVEATDGSIGKIDEASTETSRRYLVVDTGFWIFGKKRLIPAGVLDRVDHDDRKVYVSMTKDQIKNAPTTTNAHPVAMTATTRSMPATTTTTAADRSARSISAARGILGGDRASTRDASSRLVRACAAGMGSGLVAGQALPPRISRTPRR